MSTTFITDSNLNLAKFDNGRGLRIESQDPLVGSEHFVKENVMLPYTALHFCKISLQLNEHFDFKHQK
ncbi:hypothetical protein BLOT_004404 [Blomia tropicalis]|nr:hypothetical protein BLOT_004404 [Blomia tropicalis]